MMSFTYIAYTYTISAEPYLYLHTLQHTHAFHKHHKIREV